MIFSKNIFKNKLPAFIFVALFYLNIASKDLFTIIITENSVYLITISVSIISILISIGIKRKFKYTYLRSISFFFYLLAMSIVGNYHEYGISKAILGIFVPLVIFYFFQKKKWDEREVIRYLCLAVLLLDLIVIIIKFQVGFFNRSYGFVLLGPITFGWLNGMAFISLILLKVKNLQTIFWSIFFLLMVLWSESKGPLISALIIALIFYKRVFGNKNKTKILIILVIGLLWYFISKYVTDIRSINMIILYANSPDEVASGLGRGSIGSRQDFFRISLDIIKDNPFAGVGFGGWSEYASPEFKYPHNILLELITELGVLGLCFFVFFISPLKRRGVLTYVGLFVFVALMFSGDMSYFRYAFFPFLIGEYLYKKNKNDNNM